MNSSSENTSKNEDSKNMDDDMKFIYEVNSPMKPNKFQKWIKEIKKRYKLSLIFDLADLAITMAFCSLIIISNYKADMLHMNQSFFWFNFSSIIYFFLNYIFNLLTTTIDSKSEFIIYNLIEVITIIPFFIIRVIFGLYEDLTSDGHKITAALVSLRIFRVEYLVKYFQSEVNKKLYTICCSFFCFLITSTILINTIENSQSVGKFNLFLPRDCTTFDNCSSANESLHSTFFFIMTTVSTIGFYSGVGSVLGRIMIIVIILVSIIQIPSKSSELMNLLSSKSVYSRISYKKLDKVNYILITGNISYYSVYDLLREYFHPDHGENEKHALILMPQRPDANMKSLLSEYQNKLYYFEGDPLKESDLKRCQFKDANTIILLCNKQTDDPNAEDSKIILQAMAIRKYLSQENDDILSSNKKKKNETKMLIQLLRPESELHFSLSISKKNNLDQIFCIDEIKLSLLAKSCLCQGIIALISNLIMTSNLENINQKLLDNNRWLDEYKKGKGYEIYKVQLDFLRGYEFNELCEMFYIEKSIILFGVNIESKIDNTSLVLLNPADFTLPLSNDIIVSGYVLAEDKGSADELVTWSQTKKKTNLKLSTRSLSNPNTTKRLNVKRKLIQQDNDTGEATDEENLSDNKDEKNDLYSTDVITFSKICHITNEPIDRSAVTMENIDSMLIAKDHIIILGISQNTIDFIKPLRAKHLPKSSCPTIVILCKELPDDKIWNTISFFDQIYLIQGDPMSKSDLYRAGIKFAKKVVILAPSIHEISRLTHTKREDTQPDEIKSKTARKLTREEENLLDAKTIFKYNMISKIKKDIFIVIELINPKNVSFLYNKGRDQNDEYRFINKQMNIDSTGSFAAGEVYFSSIMDNLITQAYYNQSLLFVLKKIILGEDQTSYKKNPLRRYRDVVSANLYLIDFPASLKNGLNNNASYNTNFPLVKESSNKDNFISFNNIQSSKDVNMNNLNNDNEFDRITTLNKITYKDMYLLLLKQKTVLIGIYRAIDSKTNYTLDKIGKFNNSNFYYVVTSPDPDTEISPKDKLFVFSQTFPEDDFLETNPSNKDIKMFNLQNETNYDFSFFGVSKMNKKNEEKKDNPKTLDQIGEKKLNDLNEGLDQINYYLEQLKNSMSRMNSNLEKNISEAVKNKFKEISELNTSLNKPVFSEINEQNELEEASKINEED